LSKQKSAAQLLSSLGRDRTIFQPLSVALVGLVLILLFLAMALLNLKALNKTLVQFTANEGLIIIKNIQQGAEGLRYQLERTPETLWNTELSAALGADTVSLHESFLLNLMDLAQEIDSLQASAGLDREQIRTLAVEEHLQLIAFIDETGRIALQNRPVPPQIVQWTAPVIEGRQTFKIDGFNRPTADQGRGLIALRRKSGRGAVILSLEAADIDYRKARFALLRAIDNLEPPADLAYVIVTDSRGQILRQRGSRPANSASANRSEPSLRLPAGVFTRRIAAGEHPLQEIAAPILMDREFSGDIRLGLTTTVTDRILQENKRSIFISTTFMGLIAGLAMWLLYKSQNRFLNRMQQMERRVQRVERLSALGRLAAGVAHEIRNPLNAISMAAQRLQRDNPHELAGLIRAETRRLDQIIEEFLSLSGSRSLQFQPHDLRELLQHITLLISEEADARGIRLQAQWPATPCPAAMDADKMKQALLNIVKNALESISGPGTITLTLDSDREGGFRLRVADSGTGLAREQIEHIFDLDYTTKEKGLGFGLALAHEIIRAHGGEIGVFSRLGGGTTFEIRLPREPRPGEPGVAVQAPRPKESI